ncbi:MAG: HIT family protein [bacterium]
MSNCVFCKIIKGEVPAHKVYEDENVLAFLDIAPIAPGHTLVVPKNHFETFVETDDFELANLITVSKKVGQAMKQGLSVGGFNVCLNNDRVAGQIVFHTHLHVIPRVVDDELKPWPGKKYPSEEEAENTAIKISKALE